MTCPECADQGTVLVNVLPLDRFGCPQDIIEAPCPACSAGDREAAHRIGRTRVIEDALAENPEWPHQPPPVDTEDFLRDIDALSKAALAPAPSPRTETALGGPTVSHRDDADADAEGRPASAIDSSLVPSRSPASPGATATTTSEAAASADSPPGRRSNLQGRVLAGSAILTLYSACLLAATALGRVVG